MKKQFLLLLALLVFVLPAYAGIRPSFSARDCAWNATHIVIATEDPVIDGVLTVLESWKGDLEVGETITIPELAEFAARESREIDPNLREYDAGTPTHVTCQKMVLFLKRKVKSPEKDAQEGNNEKETDKKEWASTSSIWDDRIFVSVAWIENDRIYAFREQFSSSSLTAFHGPGLEQRSESTLKKLVQEILEVREKFDRAISLKNPVERAEALAPFVRNDIFIIIVMDALEKLEKCGKDAIPVLRRIIQEDSTKGIIRDDIIQLFAKLGGAQLGPELTDMLSEEFGYWLATGPALDQHWWGDNAQTDRYDKLDEILKALMQTSFEGCKGEVADIRKFWISLPQLEQYDRITKTCDSILAQFGQQETDLGLGKPEEKPDKETHDEKQAPGFTLGENEKQKAGRLGDSKAAGFTPAENKPPGVSKKQPAPPERHESGESGFLPIFLIALGAFAILLVLTRKRADK